MTRAEMIQTILRSELIQWKEMTKDQLIQCLLIERREVLDEQGIDTLDFMMEEIDPAEVWATAI